MGRKVSIAAFLARRFLLAKRPSKSSEADERGGSGGFVSFIAWVSVAGIALGVWSLVVVTSVVNGFEAELSRVISGMNGDVILYSRGEPIRDPGVVEKKIRRIVPEVQSISASFVTEVMASGPHGVAGAVLEGIDLRTIGQVTLIPERLVSGRMPAEPGEVAIGTALGERLGAPVGSELRLILPFTGEEGEKGGEYSGGPRAVKAQVVGWIRMGMHEYDSKFVFSTLEGVQNFVSQQGRVTSFKLKLSEGSDFRQASVKLSDSFGYPFRAKDWAQLNKNLFYAIRLEKVVIAILLTAIMVVAAFNVVSTLMMMIHDKTKEISILKAMGLGAGPSFRLFCWIGLGMGGVGTLLGLGLGLLANWILKKTGFISLPPEIYYIGFLPVRERWGEVAMIAGGSLLIAFFATLYPGLKVARRSPLDGLRYE